MTPPVAPIIADLPFLWLDESRVNRVFFKPREKIMASHIMVVDDNEVNLVLLGKILELEGHQVTLAHDGWEAIRFAVQKMPDMAILDVMMPEMNGFELCRKMRQPPFSTKIPIVMLTAMNCETERAQALEAGANDIWSKPFDIDLFRRRIGEFLQSAT
jgi:CheY-like chemotaxis protein